MAAKEETKFGDNPVLVKIGVAPGAGQTPIYQWQVEQDPDQLTRPKSPDLKLNFTGKQSELLNDLYRYEIVPDAKLKSKLDFFYTPYNTKFLLRKHMTFDKPEELVIVGEAGDPEDKARQSGSLDLIREK